MNVDAFFNEHRWVIPFVVPVLLLFLGAIFGHRLSNNWAERRKRRELELALVDRFYDAYGKFRAVWTFWNQCLIDLEHKPVRLARRRTVLLNRACQAEA